ncbi:MAG TPA: hypothetical protein VLI39_10750 [Sedimentisphaerales bacterium]|nr:hypothetical protein [Sedimentisphaerales bacterium]
MTDQQTIESLAGTLEVRLGAFPAAGQLPVRLLDRIGGIDLRQWPGSDLTEQLLGVPPIRLDPIAGLSPDQRRSDDLRHAAELLHSTLERESA